MLLSADIDIAARTVWGEARSEPWAGQVAVAHVLLNRWKARHRRETTLAGVALEPWQFSCWNEGDPNRAKLSKVGYESGPFRTAVKAVLHAIEQHQRGKDPTMGATHYKTPAARPRWAQGHRPVIRIGGHQFYTGIR